MSNRVARFWGPGEELPPPEAVRQAHERWLNHALEHPERTPRIPVRRLDEGGFADLLRQPRGRAWARSWWESTFAAVDDQW